MNIRSEKMKRALFLISFAIILMWALENIGGFLAVGQRTLSILMPFLIGIGIAFIFNKPMEFIERLLFDHKLGRKVKDSFKRPISYSVTLIVGTIILILVLFFMIPELMKSMEDLADRIPAYIESIQTYADNHVNQDSFVIKKLKAVDWDNLQDSLLSFLKESGPDWLGTTFSFASSIVGGLLTFGLAFVFSAYVLLKKETLIKQVKKVIIAFFPKRAAERIFHIGDLSNEAFIGFLSGKLREAVVIIVLFFISMSIFKFPFALMISTIIGTLSLIPWFGAFIGFAIGFFLILVVSTKMAFWFIVLFIVLYQVEGNLIYPFVVGKASGLSSIWIFVAGIIGGSVGGLAGIILAIPVFSVLFTLFQETVHHRLERKGIKDLEKA